MTREEFENILNTAMCGIWPRAVDAKQLIMAEYDRLVSLLAEYAWIPVTESLPDDSVPVLVYADAYDSVPCVAHLEMKDFRRWYLTAWNNEKIINVTHWMPLPESPR